MEIDVFTETELATAQSRVFVKYIGNPEFYQSERPVGIILGGQPASGKSRLPAQVRNQYKDVRFVFINGDEYRQYHPRAQEIEEEYGQDAPKYTQPFSNTLVEYLKAECLRLRCSFIIEGTMRTYAVIERTAQEIKQAGFRCEAHALAVHRQDSLLGVFQRFESDKQRTGVGRFSPIEVHDEAYRQIPLKDYGLEVHRFKHEWNSLVSVKTDWKNTTGSGLLQNEILIPVWMIFMMIQI